MGDTQTDKLHAACDECRTRKLKCSGGMPACIRCERESIRCRYSPQKPMGRPRKRRRDDAPAERTPEANVEHIPTPNDNFVQGYSEIGPVPPSIIDHDFSGFTDFQLEEGLTGGFLPPSYTEALLNGLGDSGYQNLDFSADTIDPSLWITRPISTDPSLDSNPASTPSQPGTGPCTCLSIAFLTVTDLHSITSFAFPGVVPRLRHAMTSASTMMQCPKCPQDTFMAIQNVQALSSLLSAISERFHKVLLGIEAEAARLEAMGEKKPFRVGDNSIENAHLHTGTLDCPMGFNLMLDPKDWKRLAKQALKGEVMGGGGNSTPLVSLLDRMEKRQRRWHSDESMHTEERARIYGAEDMCKSRGEAGLCLRMVHHIRRMVQQMNWD